MALNLQTLKTRSLTAVVFVVVMLGGLLTNQWTLFALFSLVHFGAWQEYQKIVAKIDPDYAGIHELHKYGVMLMLMVYLQLMLTRIGSLLRCHHQVNIKHL